jgi:hypothetical protein
VCPHFIWKDRLDVIAGDELFYLGDPLRVVFSLDDYARLGIDFENVPNHELEVLY